jgi:hypothetical protein
MDGPDDRLPGAGDPTARATAAAATMTHPELTWETLDWDTLERLRAQFLSGRPPDRPYFNSHADLANYEFTFAQRIAWKWDSVLRELRQRGWTLPPGPVLDWGCGSGIAGRRVLGFADPAVRPRLRVFDPSVVAREFAAEAARREFPDVPVESLNATQVEGLQRVGVLVVSHVLNELDEAGGQALRKVIERAEAVLWVEPGTFADSRALIKVRESLREQFRIVAPCPHQERCGLLTEGNRRHWCHHFAKPPAGIMAHSGWVRFAQRAGLDLRSLPVSFLVLERPGVRAGSTGCMPPGWSRVLGSARVYKGFAKILSCQAEGVEELELQKRVSREAFKAFRDDEAEPLWRWKLDQRRIVELTPHAARTS